MKNSLLGEGHTCLKGGEGDDPLPRGTYKSKGGEGDDPPQSHQTPTLDPPEGFQNWENFGNCHNFALYPHSPPSED